MKKASSRQLLNENNNENNNFCFEAPVSSKRSDSLQQRLKLPVLNKLTIFLGAPGKNTSIELKDQS